MDIIEDWRQQAESAYDEYRKRDCGTRIYTKDKICRRMESVIINMYINYLCLTKGSKIAGNHRRYVNKGERERKDELNIIINEWHLNDIYKR